MSALGVGNANNTGGPTPTTAGEDYEVPVVTLRQAGSQGAVYQDTSQPYETLGMTTSRSNEQWHMEKHIYHVLETSTEVISCIFVCISETVATCMIYVS